MYKKILVPVDGSEFSKEALRHGAKITSETPGSHLTVIHVIDLPPQLKSLKSYKLVRDQLSEEGGKILKEAGDIVSTYNISHDEKMTAGVPADEIVREAKEGRYDLIVIGSRGLGDVKGWLLGSVSRRVVKHSGSPVLVIK